MNILHYVKDHIAWSKVTFPDRDNVEYLLRHIEKELNEIAESPDDAEEWIDILILTIDGLWKSGCPTGVIAKGFLSSRADATYLSQQTILESIRLEIAEIREDPQRNRRCWMSILNYAYSGALGICHCHGGIMAELHRKQAINFSRTWILPEDPQAPIEHAREEGKS